MGRVASDTGGTFTDLVDDSGRVVKVPSTPDDPGRAVAAGLRNLVGGDAEVLAHGTTVATNALLERRGARVALVATEGFADVIEIGRQDRPSLYDLTVDRPAPLVGRDRRVEVPGRLDAAGRELAPLDLTALDAVQPDLVDAVAVCLLHSDLDGAHERAVAAVLRDRGFDVTVSSELAPEFREYERMATAVVNAYLRPVCTDYLRSLRPLAREVLVMTSAGGLTSLADAAERPAALLLSGPAGGVAAATAAAVANGFADAVTFDMGGTSTDVCLVRDGRPAPAAERIVAGFPVRLPALDVHTIGAGGGSIARIDDGGALIVGPRSAGAVPGPACYGLGGVEPTVTDADLVLGRLPADHGLPGIGPLDLGAARAALARAGVTAAGVSAVAEAGMEQAIRAVSVARGVDPRNLALVAFGGAGPVHACALADALGMAAVVVPPRAGVTSAVGILAAPVQVDRVVTWPTPLDHAGLERARAALAGEASRALGAPDEVLTELDCRYAGQSHEVRVDDIGVFHAAHERLNGYARPDQPVEVVAVRATARRWSPVAADALPAMDRRAVRGPAVVVEDDCTIVVPDGWRGVPGPDSSLVLRRT